MPAGLQVCSGTSSSPGRDGVRRLATRLREWLARRVLLKAFKKTLVKHFRQLELTVITIRNNHPSKPQGTVLL